MGSLPRYVMFFERGGKNQGNSIFGIPPQKNRPRGAYRCFPNAIGWNPGRSGFSRSSSRQPQGGHRGHAQVLKFRFMLFFNIFLFLSSGWGRRCRHVGTRWCRCGVACGRGFRNIGPLWGCCGRWGASRGPNRALKFFAPSHPIIHLPIPS